MKQWQQNTTPQADMRATLFLENQHFKVQTSKHKSLAAPNVPRLQRQYHQNNLTSKRSDLKIRRFMEIKLMNNWQEASTQVPELFTVSYNKPSKSCNHSFPPDCRFSEVVHKLSKHTVTGSEQCKTAAAHKLVCETIMAQKITHDRGGQCFKGLISSQFYKNVFIKSVHR